MVDWQAPSTIESEYESLVKLAHVCNGIFIWECVTTLIFDYKLIAKKSASWRLPVGTYILCRLLALAYVITNLVVLNVTTSINCSAASVALLTFDFLSGILALALVAFRTIAIWKQNQAVTAAVTGLWLLQVAFFIWGVVKGPTSTWLVELGGCDATNTTRNRLAYLIGFVVLVIYFGLALVGLWRERTENKGIWKLIFYQKVWWLVPAIMLTILPVVFLYLNFNDSMNLLFDNPACLGLAICATRMYRDHYETDNRVIESTFGTGLGMKFATDSHVRSGMTTDRTSTAVAVPIGMLEEGHIHIRTEQFTDQFGSDSELKSKHTLTPP